MSYETYQHTRFQTGKDLHLQLANGLHTKLKNKEEFEITYLN